MSDAPDVALLERLDALDAYFRARDMLMSGFRGEELSTRIFFWGNRGTPVFELSYEKLMSRHPLELLDLADSALTESRPSH